MLALESQQEWKTERSHVEGGKVQGGARLLTYLQSWPLKVLCAQVNPRKLSENLKPKGLLMIFSHGLQTGSFWGWASCFPFMARLSMPMTITGLFSSQLNPELLSCLAHTSHQEREIHQHRRPLLLFQKTRGWLHTVESLPNVVAQVIQYKERSASQKVANDLSFSNPFTGLDTIHTFLLELSFRATCCLHVIPCSRGCELYDTVLCGSAQLCCSSCLS